VKQAFISAEDRIFLQPPRGYDPRGIVGALARAPWVSRGEELARRLDDHPAGDEELPFGRASARSSVKSRNILSASHRGNADQGGHPLSCISTRFSSARTVFWRLPLAARLYFNKRWWDCRSGEARLFGRLCPKRPPPPPRAAITSVLLDRRNFVLREMARMAYITADEFGSCARKPRLSPSSSGDIPSFRRGDPGPAGTTSPDEIRPPAVTAVWPRRSFFTGGLSHRATVRSDVAGRSWASAFAGGLEKITTSGVGSITGPRQDSG